MTPKNFATRGLLWKEIRLVAPLILMLLGVTVLLLVLWSMFSYSSRTLAMAGRYIPLLLPLLYAAGAGAILVGQERENRTLLWFTSLPISSERVFWTKTLVALLGLAVMWVCCMPFASMTLGRDQTSPSNVIFDDRLFWFLESVFLTFGSIYTAWRFRNTYASLIAVLPLALMPTLLVTVWNSLGHSVAITGPESSAPWPLNLALMVLTILVAWLAYRAGMKELSPAEPEAIGEFDDNSWKDAWRPSAIDPMASPSTPMTFRYPLSSLVWQSIHHNSLALAGLVALLIGSLGYVALSLLDALNFGSERDFTLGLMGMGFFSCWLGGFAFTGDGTAKRLRFLADRGVSPLTAWLGRHLIGVSLLSVAVIAYAVMTIWIARAHYISVTLLPSIAMMALALWTLYGVSQWTSQFIRILPAAVVIAPIFAGCAAYWLGFAANQLQTPLWCILFCSCIPMAASLMAMRQYMDDTSQLRLWIMASVAAVVFIIIPMLPAAWTISNWPSMPNSTRASIMPEARLAYTSSVQPQSMMQKGRDEGPSLAVFSFSPEQRLQLGSDGGNADSPLAVDAAILQRALGIATYAAESLESDPDNAAKVTALGEWIETLTAITRRLRHSPRWLDQEAADVVEIWLTDRLGREPLLSRRDEPIVAKALEMIGDAKRRSSSRRSAVLATWYRAVDGRSSYWDFGGMPAEAWTPDLSPLLAGKLVERNSAAVVDRALQLIAASDAGQPTLELRRELHSLTHSATAAFEDGPYSDRMRVGGERGYALSLQQALSSPANQWYAAWESDAQKLNSSESSQDVN